MSIEKIQNFLIEFSKRIGFISDCEYNVSYSVLDVNYYFQNFLIQFSAQNQSVFDRFYEYIVTQSEVSVNHFFRVKGKDRIAGTLVGY